MPNEFARHLRTHMTDAERRLWGEPRARQIGGRRVRRQAPIGPFIADFVCFEEKLVIELDGGQHAERSEEDARRTAWLNREEFRVLRFWNTEVFENLDGVVEAIAGAWETTPHPNPPPQGGRGSDRRP